MISLKNVSASYGRLKVLSNISLDIDSNLSIIGPNGCGKTTLLRTISGVMPFSGDILINRESIRTFKPKERAKRICMLSQISSVNFNYSVYDIVMMGRYSHFNNGIFQKPTEDDIYIVECAINTVGLTEVISRDVSTLSGGQMQRVFLAKVIAQDPDIILLDEPTNHLDINYQLEIISYLKKWAIDKNKIIVGVLHDINLAVSLSDRILIMDNGNIEAHCTFEEILHSNILEKVFRVDIRKFMIESLERWRGT